LSKWEKKLKSGWVLGYCHSVVILYFENRITTTSGS